MSDKPKQTLCPYTATRLGESGPTDREHVTPIAIGAPEKFWVASHKSGNAHWNKVVDAPFTNNECIRFFSMSNNVRSRSGDVDTQLQGVIAETGDRVKILFSNDGMDINFVQPVERQDASNYLVKGYGEKAQRQAEEVKKNLAKKGFVPQACETITIERPTIQSRLNLDTGLAELQLIKTAYLYTVWCLGDYAISSPNRSQYINALQGSGIMSSGVELTNRIEGNHQFALLVIDDKVYCEVDLFGMFKGIFVTNLSQSFEPFAQYSCIDLKKRLFNENKELESLLIQYSRKLSCQTRNAQRTDS